MFIKSQKATLHVQEHTLIYFTFEDNPNERVYFDLNTTRWSAMLSGKKGTCHDLISAVARQEPLFSTPEKQVIIISGRIILDPNLINCLKLTDLEFVID